MSNLNKLVQVIAELPGGEKVHIVRDKVEVKTINATVRYNAEWGSYYAIIQGADVNAIADMLEVAVKGLRKANENYYSKNKSDAV